MPSGLAKETERRVVVVMDDLEALVGRGAANEDAEPFVAACLEAAEADGEVSLVWALRDDALGQCTFAVGALLGATSDDAPRWLPLVALDGFARIPRGAAVLVSARLLAAAGAPLRILACSANCGNQCGNQPLVRVDPSNLETRLARSKRGLFGSFLDR